MNCTAFPTSEMSSGTRRRLASYLTKEGSDFQRSLISGAPISGAIAIVDTPATPLPFGWCRSEVWKGMQTLEAFVAGSFRGQGVATYAAMGLSLHCGLKKVAVFAPAMVSVARRAGLDPTLFIKDGAEWKEA